MPRGIRKPKADRPETAAEALERAKRELAAIQSSMADLEAAAAREAEELAKRGPRAVAVTAALKEAIFAFKRELPDDQPEWMRSIVPQSYPKEAAIGKRYGLSETQIHSAKEKGAKAISSL